MPCKNILIVEDEVDIRRQISEALNLEEYETFGVANGQEALEYLVNLNEIDYPACIILDLMMPIMDGRVFMQTVHERYKDKLGTIPIIVATAKGGLIEAENLPYAVQRIQKPFDIEELYMLVKRYF
jgi:CheY-like chemotaxis protein